MKISNVVMLGMLALGLASTAYAQEADALYKSKCATCHGDQGQGKPKLGAKLAGTAKSEAEITALLTKGGGTKTPHVKPMSALTPEQSKAVAEFVKSLK
jgi:mono/diheme cytochrome c family protein